MIVLIGIAVLAGGTWFFIRPPSDFPSGSIVTIQSGASVSGVAETLTNNRIIDHPRIFSLLVRLTGASGHLQAGGYLFSTPQTLITVVHRLATGNFGFVPARITLPEGLTAREMGLVIAKSLPVVTPIDFRSAGEPYEGYLFPDTYLFLPTATADSIVSAMRMNFDARIASVTPDIRTSGHTLSDIVTMASLLEREAKSFQDKKMVAGILWNRIRIGMPLQVDAVFGYIHDRDTYSPTFADLQVDSPYNTYRNKGLPPGPIDNPGLDSIEAAATPAKTSDLYYLTGTDGRMHYAATFAEHKQNRALYLNQ
jgi:UPF0755 protein